MNYIEKLLFFFTIMAILLIMNNYMIKDDGTFEMFTLKIH
jgi:hypothetical protein